MRRKLIPTLFLGLKDAYAIEGLSTPRSCAASSEQTSGSREDEDEIDLNTLLIGDIGYSFCLPPGFNVLESYIKDDEEEHGQDMPKVGGAEKEVVSDIVQRAGVDLLECSLGFLGPAEILCMSTTCRSFFFLCESFWPEGRGLLRERIMEVRGAENKLAGAHEMCTNMKSRIAVWSKTASENVNESLKVLKDQLCIETRKIKQLESSLAEKKDVLKSHIQTYAEWYGVDKTGKLKGVSIFEDRRPLSKEKKTRDSPTVKMTKGPKTPAALKSVLASLTLRETQDRAKFRGSSVFRVPLLRSTATCTLSKTIAVDILKLARII